jgi:hypothetical protein
MRLLWQRLLRVWQPEEAPSCARQRSAEHCAPKQQGQACSCCSCRGSGCGCAWIGKLSPLWLNAFDFYWFPSQLPLKRELDLASSSPPLQTAAARSNHPGLYDKQRQPQADEGDSTHSYTPSSNRETPRPQTATTPIGSQSTLISFNTCSH